MMRAYKYLFYTLYRQRSRWKNDLTSSQFNAFLLTSAILFCSLIVLVEIMDLFLGWSFIAKLSKTEVVLALAMFTIPQYFLLLHKDRYKQIVKEFESESPCQKRVGGIAVILYQLILFLAIIGVAILHGRALNH
jgi:hypothetical protein